MLVEIINKSNLEYVFKLSNLFINNKTVKSKLKFLNIFCKIYHFIFMAQVKFFVKRQPKFLKQLILITLYFQQNTISNVSNPG
jgi:hypothetical protein